MTFFLVALNVYKHVCSLVPLAKFAAIWRLNVDSFLKKDEEELSKRSCVNKESYLFDFIPVSA